MNVLSSSQDRRVYRTVLFTECISAFIPDNWVLPCLEFGPDTITSDFLSGKTCLITVACHYAVITG